MPKSIPFDIPASSTPQKGVIEISDPVPTLNGTTIGFTQADPKITISGATPIPVPTPVPVPSPDVQDIKFIMQDLTKGDYARPGAGANNFYGGNGMQSPLIVPYLDNDQRFLWKELQTGPTTYNFANLDAAINKMISAGGKLSFRVTTCDSGNVAYPSFIPSAGTNQPDFNSETYVSAYEKFIFNLAAHLKSVESVKKGIPLIAGVYKIDIGGIGNWSEMHWSSLTVPVITAANGKRIINAYTSNFPRTWLMITISGLTNNSSLGSELAKALLYASNELGPVGIRCDHLGWINTFAFDMDASKYYTSDMLAAVKGRYLTSPIGGELMNNLSGINSANPYSDLEDERKQIGLSQFSNNNFCRLSSTGASSAQVSASDKNILAVSAAAGARVSMQSASISSGKISINWKVDNAPVYEAWQVWVVTDAGSIQSSMGTIKGFTGTKTSVDTLPAGAKTISIILKDPDGYRAPYPLLNAGRQADGSYKVI